MSLQWFQVFGCTLEAYFTCILLKITKTTIIMFFMIHLWLSFNLRTQTQSFKLSVSSILRNTFRIKLYPESLQSVQKIKRGFGCGKVIELQMFFVEIYLSGNHYIIKAANATIADPGNSSSSFSSTSLSSSSSSELTDCECCFGLMLPSTS